AKLGLGPDSLVVEIASNDGYLLQYFVQKGIPVLGIEPSGSVAKVAQEKGVPTLVEFFGTALAERLAAEGRHPALICSANVLAHVPDIDDFVGGVAALLTGDAVYTVEFPHLLNLIEKVQFDTIYHEHYSYLSLLAVEGIFAGAGLRVFDVEELPTHGGSLRVFACLQGASHAEGPGLTHVRAREAAAKLDRAEGYQGFTARVAAVRDGLLDFLRTAKAEGRSVAAYGAAAKGNTLLNYAGIGPDLIAYCVDRNPAKQDTLLPGSHIPVRPVEALRAAPPDYVVILPWNIRDEVIGQMADLAATGTRFVTAVPEIRIT
ncbi:MAG: methyltransferase domain-containing protein, partial [Mangrovicoccus sp.]|nr:methyltransferase domain-containing protein [Mangrovicoccus sp.]